MKRITCPVCDQTQFTFRFTKKERDFWRCDACGLIKQHPLPTPEALEAYYDQSYAQGMYESFAAATQMKELTATSRMKQILRHVPMQGSWLDVGCANGVFVKVAREQGVDAVGVELSENAVARAQADGLPVTQGTLSDYAPQRRFDCITAFDVLEHVIDPVSFLNEIRSRLTRDGYAILTLPNLNSWPAKLMGKNWYFYIPEEHLHYFGPANLRLLAEKCGLQCISIQSTYKPLTINYSLIQFAEYNPWIYKALRAATAILPHSLKERSIPLYIGEMMLVVKGFRSAKAA